jgi:pyrroloquinoline quinone biosynthesis protein B
VCFTHLNHSNPALDRDSAARRSIEARGFHVLDEDDEFPL